MKLYSGPLSMFGAKAQIALHEKGLAFELEMVPFEMDRLYEPKHPEVERINPKRQVPVLVDGELEIFDSTQIFEYLEDLAPSPPLWPPGAAARARARLFEHKVRRSLLPAHHSAHEPAENPRGSCGYQCTRECGPFPPRDRS